MNMKKTITIIAFILLVGCQKFRSLSGGREIPTQSTSPLKTLPMSPPSQPIYLTMGQSNMVLIQTEAKETLQEALGSDAVIIPCALGGTYLEQWQVDGLLFNQCFDRLESYRSAYGGHLAGIAFYQGESDATSKAAPYPTHVNDYGSKLAATFNDYRRVLKDQKLKIVLAPIASTNDPDYIDNWPIIKEQQKNLVQQYTDKIDTSDFDLRDQLPYKIHISPESAQLAAKRFGEKLRLTR